MDETELIERIGRKDPAALMEFLALRREPLLAFIARSLGPALRRKIEPEDIFQEVSAEGARSLPEVELGDRDPFSWLCQVAQRKIIDAHRHFSAQKRDSGREIGLGGSGSDTQQPGIVNLLVASMTTPSQAFSRNAKELRLQDALLSLPEEQREVLRLRYVEGWPTKQIADQIGKSDAAIRVMLTRSLKKLQTILGVEG